MNTYFDYKLLKISIFLYLIFWGTAPLLKAQQSNELPELPSELQIQGITISLDGKRLVFATVSTMGWKLYEMDKEGDKWTVAAPIDAINAYISGETRVQSPFLTYDGRFLYYAANISEIPGGSGGMDIYFSEYKDNKWTVPQNAGMHINTNADENSPSLSPNGKQLYFTRPNKNAEVKNVECKTIFKAELNKKNEWSLPLPLPSHISYDCEESPYIAADGKTLMFASVRTTVERGFDIFMSRKLDYDFWSPAIRIDSLNSEINDLQPQYAGNEWMYWVRQRAVKNEKFYASQSKKIEPQLCPQSVFSLSGSFTTSDSATKAGRIIVNDVLHSVNIDTIWQPRNQTNYLIILPVGKMYSFQFSDSLATTHVQTVDTRSFTKNTAEQENVNLSNWIELECKVFEPEKFGNKVAKADFAFRDIDIGEKLDIFVREIAIGLYSMQLPVGVKTEISITKDNCQTYTEVVDLQGVVHFSKFKKEIRLQPNSKVLEVTVSDFLTNETLDAEIIITNTKNKEEQISKIEAARNGLAKATLRTNSRYLVEVLPKPQYFFNTTYIDINANPVARLDVKLRKMEVGLTLETYEIQFVAGSNELNPSSHSYLNRLAEMLTNNSQLKLQIALSSDRKEMVKNFGVLSETRLQTIFHYLQSKGVNNSQLATLVMPEYDAETTGIKTGNPVKVELKVLEL